MALNPKLSDAAANAAADAIGALLSNGYVRIYDGTQPANANTAINGSTNHLLAELRFGTPAFGSAVAGVITADAITEDSDANATGTASFYRMLQSDGTTVVMDGSIDTATANIIMGSTAIQQHAAVSISAFAHTIVE